MGGIMPRAFLTKGCQMIGKTKNFGNITYMVRMRGGGLKRHCAPGRGLSSLVATSLYVGLTNDVQFLDPLVANIFYYIS